MKIKANFKYHVLYVILKIIHMHNILEMGKKMEMENKLISAFWWFGPTEIGGSLR